MSTSLCSTVIVGFRRNRPQSSSHWLGSSSANCRKVPSLVAMVQALMCQRMILPSVTSGRSADTRRVLRELGLNAGHHLAGEELEGSADLGMGQGRNGELADEGGRDGRPCDLEY